MTLTEGVKQKGCPFQISDCSRNELPLFLIERGYKVGAEIGVYVGEYTERFCSIGLHMYAIDPWVAYSGTGRTFQRQETQDDVYNKALERLSMYENCKMVRKNSMDALNDFRDGSLDFVYIDGNHDFRHIAEDLYEWSKKVRSGGVVSGHDYYHTPHYARNVVCHVRPIVDAYVKQFNIENFYTFGISEKNSQNIYDKYLSWMWFKP